MSTVENDDLFGIFNKPVESMSGVRKGEEDEGGSNLSMFKPDPTKSDDKVWRGTIKFLPNIKDQNHPMVKKVTYWLSDPRGAAGHGKFRYDSPKSTGKYAKCQVADKYWAWKESKDARLIKLSGKLSYNKKAFALIQVLVDAQNSDNNGKIFIFELPVKLQNMIESKMYPSQADIDNGDTAENVFEPFIGPVMNLKVGLKVADGETFRDWDACEWHKKNFGMTIDGKLLVENLSDIKNPKIVTRLLPTDPEELLELKKATIEVLKSAPDLDEFKYVAPSDEMQKKVAEVLQLMAGQPVNADEPEPDESTDAQTATNVDQSTEEQSTKPEDTPTSNGGQKSSKDLVDDLLG